jgi:mycothiol system anti-sigma-R factor
MSRDCNCDEALANLYTYLDAEMERAEADRIQAHLDDCGGCDRPFEFERRLREVVRIKLSEEVPETMIIRIRTLLAYETRR